MPDEKGSILVTGANGGLGTAIAKQIASRPDISGYYGIYLVRDEKAPALRPIMGHHAHAHNIVSIDLTDFDSVRQAAQKINERVARGAIPPIRALILNAAYQNFSGQTFGANGLDDTFTANYLGHWLLALLLLQSMDRESGRIVVVGSQAYDQTSSSHRLLFPTTYSATATIISDEASLERIANGTWHAFDPNDPLTGWSNGYRRYGAAKLCAMMMMHELQHRLDQQTELNRICVLTVDPGYMSTGLQRTIPWLARLIIFDILFTIIVWLFPNGPIRRPETSASHILRAAFDFGPGLGEHPKALFFEGAKKTTTSSESRDLPKRKLVWRESVKLTHVKDGETALADWR